MHLCERVGYRLCFAWHDSTALPCYTVVLVCPVTQLSLTALRHMYVCAAAACHHADVCIYVSMSLLAWAPPPICLLINHLWPRRTVRACNFDVYGLSEYVCNNVQKDSDWDAVQLASKVCLQN